MAKILVTQSSMPPMEEYFEEIRELWDTHWITNMGAKHRQLQAALGEYLGTENVELFVNGHMAIEMALQAMQFEGEVITTPFTFASTTHAIVCNGLKPVFCDINPDDYTIDVDKIESLISDRTCAILPVHVYGNLCKVDEIERIARKHGLKVIYDACHAFGESCNGLGVANYGDVSCFSFHATKVFNTIEGGAACFRDSALGDILYGLKNFGIRGPETVDAIGANAKMNEFCAAMGLCNLRHVDDEIAKRKRVHERYMSNLSGIKGIKLKQEQPGVVSNYAYFPIVVDETIFGRSRDDIMTALEAQGIGCRKYFYPLVNEFDCYKGEYSAEDTPIALEISRRVLCLPMYAELETEEVDRVCEGIKQFL